MTRSTVSGLCIGVLALALAPAAFAGGVNWADGQWRVEGGVVAAFDDAGADRSNDVYAKLSFEYEASTDYRVTMGVRLYPMFLYLQDEPRETIYGAGGGLVFRLYQREQTRDGFYVEAGSSLLVHANRFEGNGSNVNFLSEAGIGYKVPHRPMHVALKVEHISNAGLKSDNAGVNGVSLSLRLTF